MFSKRTPCRAGCALLAALLLLPAAATAARSSYSNPFDDGSYYTGRTDMGVDYSVARHKPIVAIGTAKVLGAEHNSGWPGGHYLWYRLLDGSHAGQVVYVAETNRVECRLARKGPGFSDRVSGRAHWLCRPAPLRHSPGPTGAGR